MKILTQLGQISKWRKTITCAIHIATINPRNFKQPTKESLKKQHETNQQLLEYIQSMLMMVNRHKI